MLEIINLPLSEIIPYENNTKEHPQEQIDQIIVSIRDYQVNDPIAIDENNVIIEGHGRIIALQQLRAETVPCIRLSHLTEAQKRAYAIAHNKLTMNSGFDIEKLRAEFDFLRDADFELSKTGFTFDEIAGMFNISEPKEVTEDDFDVDGELKKSPITRKGDIYLLGEHRLICGDSTQADTYDRLMDGKRANLVVTDPPYNVNYEGKTKDRLKIDNDKQNDEDFYKFLLDFFTNTERVMSDDASIYVFHSDTEGLHFRTAFDSAGLYLSGTCIWKKNSLVMGRSPYHWQHEPVLFGWKKKGKHKWYSDRKQSTIWEFDRPTKSVDHPTMKPIPLIAYPIANSSTENSIVLDPFGGSGSTLIACEQTGRICYTSEIDEKYCDVIVNRYIAQRGGADGVDLIRGGIKKEVAQALEAAT
ncbi:methyltransferase [Clostridia bacterium]|nr:methyltransferase [Clostridia bacterium]